MSRTSVGALALGCALVTPAIGHAADADYIVVYDSHSKREQHANARAATPKKVYSVIPAMAITLTDEEAAQYAADTDVAFIEEDYEVYALSEFLPAGVEYIGAPEVWPVSMGESVTVAVLDTGYDFTHPDAPNIVGSETFGWGDSAQDGGGHGTHVTGIIAAPANGLGVVGVAPEVDILVGKVLSDGGYGHVSNVISGIEWAVDNGADVINLSLGFGGESVALEAACEEASASTLIVAAAGNSASSYPFIPASYDSVLSVSAVDESGQIASFSTYGPTIDLAAPGVDVLSSVVAGAGVEAQAIWDGVDHASNPVTGTAKSTVTGAVYSCGLATGDADNSCPAEVAGGIAHVRRGDITFKAKVEHAVSMGAVGVIISNNLPGNFLGTLLSDSPAVVVSVSQDDGDTLDAALPVEATISVLASDYERKDGTSMASPHVAGAAALVLGACDATVDEVRDALLESAEDLGEPGPDDFYGFGLVDPLAAVTLLGCLDADEDGVTDDVDLCLDTEPGAIVDADGCSAAQIVLQDCGDPDDARNHGQYVKCVAAVTREAVDGGLLTRAERGQMIAGEASGGSGSE